MDNSYNPIATSAPNLFLYFIVIIQSQEKF